MSDSLEFDAALEQFNRVADNAIARIRTARANAALKLRNAVGVLFICGHGVQCLDLSPKQRGHLAWSLCPSCRALVITYLVWKKTSK